MARHPFGQVLAQVLGRSQYHLFFGRVFHQLTYKRRHIPVDVVGEDTMRLLHWTIWIIVGLLAVLPTLHWIVGVRDPFGRPFLLWASGQFGPSVEPVLIVVWAFASGLVLYALRCSWPHVYGVIEIVVGAYIATFLVNLLLIKPTEPTNDAIFFTVVGALYIIVRGLDNLHRALKPATAPTRHWNKWFFGKDSEQKLP
jgi:hypothetical protein